MAGGALVVAGGGDWPVAGGARIDEQGVVVGHTTGAGQLQGGHVPVLGFVVEICPVVPVCGLVVDKILISAQLTNVSGSFPIQLFPVVHHH